jgi:hypothetical protein
LIQTANKNAALGIKNFISYQHAFRGVRLACRAQPIFVLRTAVFDVDQCSVRSVVVCISAFAKIRIFAGAIGSGFITFGLVSSGFDLDSFVLNAPGPPPAELTRVYDVPGTELYITETTTDSGMQAQFGLFGN